jgi:hypothetical protein
MDIKLKKIYDGAPYLSIKYDTYFIAYEALLEKYRDKKITLVEIGIFNGGSLFMWREFLGPKARIIGIDLNPDALEWRKYGFEIYIGDQGEEKFWEDFFHKIGPIDVLIDDGGHTNTQQVITTHHAITNVRDGGIIIVEDVHASYFREFGNPSSFSFINFAFRIVDGINSRAFALRDIYRNYSSRVYSVSFFESMVAFHVDSRLCIKSSPTSNGAQSRGASDFRYQRPLQSLLFSAKNRLLANTVGVNQSILRGLRLCIDFMLSILSRIEILKYRRFFNRRN